MKKVILIFLLMPFLSCKSTFLKLVTKKSIDKEIKVLFNEETGSKIVFIPMIHVGKPKYYESVKSVVDSLRREGFQIYFEGIKTDKQLSEQKKQLYHKKLRKFLGFYLSFEKGNNSLPNEYTKKNYVLQSQENTGILKEKDHNLDLSIKELIEFYEAENGDIKLNKCDSISPLKEKYNCDSEYKNRRHSILYQYRDNYIRKEALKIKKKKIVMIYGKGHWTYGLGAHFVKNGYKLIEGKM